MTPLRERDAFRILFREFFAQLFISESSLSDHQVKVAMIGVLTFLIMPGFFIPVRLIDAFELAAAHFPILVSPLTRLMATVFVTFALVAVGVVAAFEWEALTFERRDAMVLGPLPVSARTVVAAKLAALGALLLIAGSGINLVTAVPFSLVATTHQPTIATVRLLVAHLVTTMSASTFVFCVLITVRAAGSLFERGRVAIGTLFQFALITALLCFIVFVPTSLKIDFLRVPHRPVRVVGVHMMPIPAWSPTNWFVGLYDVIRGAAEKDSDHQARIAVTMTAAGAIAAVISVLVGYRRQLRVALAPASAPFAGTLARAPSRMARLVAGRSRAARGLAAFIVLTLARSRAQQATVAMNAAVGVITIVIELTRRGSDFAGFLHASTALSRLPFLLAYWLAVGLRASFFVPSELPAAWTFRTNAEESPGVSHAAIRGAAAALLVPPVTALTFALSVAPGGWYGAFAHAGFAALAVLVLVELVALTVPFMPFVRPYEPGHAKLKTRWPLYLIGVYLFGYLLVRIEKACSFDSTPFALLLLGLAATVAVLDVAGKIRAKRSSIGTPVEWTADEGRIAVLDISATVFSRQSSVVGLQTSVGTAGKDREVPAGARPVAS
jgi:hypothetical protein